MFDFPKLEGPVRLALLGGLALLCAAALAVVVLVPGAPLPSPPRPLSDRAAPIQPPAAVQPPAPKADSGAWPADPEGQIRATQRLLGELRLMDETPTGQPGPATQAAIRDYQRMAGLEETGEVSEALFDSLKEMTAMVSPRSARKPD